MDMVDQSRDRVAGEGWQSMQLEYFNLAVRKQLTNPGDVYSL